MVWSIKFIKYRENKLIVTTYVQNVHLWLKHKLSSVLAIGQLYHQSATAPHCTTQLRDMRGLPLPVWRSSKPVSCTFPDNFLFLLVSSFYQKIPESVAEHCSLLIPISFKSELCLLQYQFEIFASYLLKFTWQWRHFYIMNKNVNIFLQRVFIPVSRNVKVIKIHQDFPELWLQMYCHLFMVHSVYEPETRCAFWGLHNIWKHLVGQSNKTFPKWTEWTFSSFGIKFLRFFRSPTWFYGWSNSNKLHIQGGGLSHVGSYINANSFDVNGHMSTKFGGIITSIWAIAERPRCRVG